MRVPLSWLRELTPVAASGRDIAEALIRAGFEVEQVEQVGHDVQGVVVGEVTQVKELTEFKKPIRIVSLRMADGDRSVVCGAQNISVGDRVAVALPGGLLPGDFRITARETYGHVSDGMICSSRELGISDDHGGILVLGPEAPVGADVAELLSLRDEVLDIAVTPDRGYGFSVRGIAREVATAFAAELDDPGLGPAPSGGRGGHPVVVDDVDACTRYVARVIRGLDPTAPSPLWLQRRVALTGMRPISLVVDVTNYVMQGFGQPLHAFDANTLQGAIVVREAREGEQLRSLDGADRELAAGDLVITDDSGPIALAGVMGGQTTEVTKSTVDVLIEAAHFTAVGIGRTSRRHDLVSEASKRFERGVDPDLAPAAAHEAVALLVSLGGGVADDTHTDVDHRRSRPSITMPVGFPGSRAGRAYDADVVRRRLLEVGCTVEGGGTADGADVLEVTPPAWRPDLREPVDLSEEVIRLEGYDALPSVLPRAPAGRGLTIDQRARRWIGTALAGAGCTEASTYPFMSEAVLDSLGISADDARRLAPRIANPVNDAEPVLRTTLLPGLLAVLLRNVGRGRADLALFELGPVFLDRDDERTAPRLPAEARPSADELLSLNRSLPEESDRVAAVLTGSREPAGWWGPGRAVSWSDAVELARVVASATLAPLEIRQGAAAPWHPGRCAELVVDGAVVGHAGELHPRVVSALGLPHAVVAMEVELAPLLAHAGATVRARNLSVFPIATVDVALVVDAATPAAEVEDALRAGAGPMLESIRLFDLYVGDQVPQGSKSLAFTLRFRSTETTLTDQVVNELRDAAVAEAGVRVGATLRA
ncbi:MAG TPA: phenylalanine--tRNA ligase subunit beta [Mycobacteriales bacterium]|nr:phenylalanine--tRNA ligase subunit beta [Mycobacteriales bacterium]